MEIPKQIKTIVKSSDFISELFLARTQIHIAHLQSKSHAQHIALDSFYKDIVDLIDNLVETWQGRYGIIKGYTSRNVQDDIDPVKYLTKLLEFVNTNRLALFNNDSDLLNQIDNIKTLINKTIYKLENLK